MDTVSGRFQLIENENFCEYLVAQGIEYEKAKKIDLIKPILETYVEENNFYLTTTINESKFTSVLVFDDVVEEELVLGIVVKSYTTIKDNKVIVESTGEKDEQGIREFEFTENELILTLSSNRPNVPVAKRYYKRT